MKRTENLHNQDKARERDARKAKKDPVTDVAESVRECNWHERVLRNEQQSSSENDKISPVESYRNNNSPNDHREQG